MSEGATQHLHTISIIVDNQFGVLSRIAGLFSGRGYNIESLSVATTLDPSISRITLQTRGDDSVVEQIIKQLNKLVTVIEVVEMAEADHVERELCLIKVTADSTTRSDVLNVVNIFRAKVVDVGSTECIVEIIGDDAKIRAVVALLEPIGIKEIARTGKAALFRGDKLLTAGPPRGETAGKPDRPRKKPKEKVA